MSEQTELERRYRRRLAWYPRDHREQHGEEMLGVLLAGAGERTRPSRKETTDLLRGAARIHLRRMVGADGGIDHRNVLAVVSLLGPVMILAGSASVMDQLADWYQIGFLNVTPDVPVWGVWVVVAVLSLLRLRRTAAVGAWLGTAGFVVAAAWDKAFFLHFMLEWSGWFLLGVVIAAALTWSPGPTRGWELVGGRRVAVLVAAVGTSVLLVMTSFGTFSVLHFAIWDAVLVRAAPEFAIWLLALAVLIAGGMTAAGMRTRESRRAVLVLCVPVMVTVLFLVLPRYMDELVLLALCYGLPVVALLGLGGVPRGRPTST